MGCDIYINPEGFEGMTITCHSCGGEILPGYPVRGHEGCCRVEGGRYEGWLQANVDYCIDEVGTR